MVIDITNGVSSEFQCWQKCLENSECKWYSYDSKVESCISLQTCPSIDETATDFKSGEANCEFSSTTSSTPLPTTFSTTIPTTTSPMKKASKFAKYFFYKNAFKSNFGFS